MRKFFIFSFLAFSLCMMGQQNAQTDATTSATPLDSVQITQDSTYTLVVVNKHRDPYVIYIDMRRIGVVQGHGIAERFVLPLNVYGSGKAKQESGYRRFPNVIDFYVPEQEPGDEMTAIIE